MNRTPLLGPLLKEVSRSFYLTLRLLPAAVREPIGLAYLLARTSDTIADTEVLPLPARLGTLEKFREEILSGGNSRMNLAEISAKQGSVAERILLERVNESLALLQKIGAEDRQRIRDVLQTILSGQELDLQRFANATIDNIVALTNRNELDDYTYRVAGCVGEFWTRMLQAHVLRGRFDQPRILENGIRFGKGLQLVNILRDLPADLKTGRCYIPKEELAAIEIKPSDLLRPETEPRFRKVYDSLLDMAQGHLDAGWEYTMTIPAANMRLRIACALPLVIGCETLRLLRAGKILAGERIKVPRARVRSSLVGLFIFYPWGGPWRRVSR